VALSAGSSSDEGGVGHDGRVIGPIIIIVVLVVAIPVGVVMSGAVMAGILGWGLKSDVEDANEGSELIDLNR
jgi:hypothetical protein